MDPILDYYDSKSLSAAFYDVVAAADPTLKGDLAFYSRLIAEGSWVLELGCGTGRIGLPLAEAARAVLGLDLSLDMLERAEAKRARLAPEVVQRTGFVQGDMSRFDLDHQFDAVIAPVFGFSHLRPGASRRRAFEAIARHLRQGGVAAVHALLPARIEAAEAPAPERPVLDAAYDPAGRRLRIHLVGQAFDPLTGRFEQRLDYVLADADGREARRSRERLTYYLSDIAAEAEGSGLGLVEKISPFNEAGEMWVFRKA